jgi:hypothetical protein
VLRAQVAQVLAQVGLVRQVLARVLDQVAHAQVAVPVSVVLAQVVPVLALVAQALVPHAQVVAQAAVVAALEPLVLSVKVAAAVPARPASQSVRNAKSSNRGQRPALAVP